MPTYTHPQEPPAAVLLEVEVVPSVVLDHHLRLELAVLRHVVGIGRPQRRVEVAEGAEVVTELCRRRQRQEDLTPPAVSADLERARRASRHATSTVGAQMEFIFIFQDRKSHIHHVEQRLRL